jgi:hypothetical protein
LRGRVIGSNGDDLIAGREGEEGARCAWLAEDEMGMKILPKTHMYREWNEDIVREIMEYSKKQPSGVLLLLDDLISDAA